MTGAPNSIEPAGSVAASWSGIACMPVAGTAESPSASMRKITSNIRRDVDSDGSSWIPPNSGRKKRSIICSENPASTRASRVDMSSPRSRSAGCGWRTRRRNHAHAELVGDRPDGAPQRGERTLRRAERIGDHRPVGAELHHGAGIEATQVERAQVELAVGLGYAVSITWNPRSHR